MTRSAFLWFALAGCFGSGPTPSPSTAKTIFTAPAPQPNDVCNTSSFIGPVGLFSTMGYAITLPYSPRDSNCGGGTSSGTAVEVTEFALDGSTPNGSMVMNGMAGAADNGSPPPVIVAGQAGPLFAYANPNGGGATVLGPSNTPLMFDTIGQNATVVGLALDPGSPTLYVGAVPTSGGGSTDSDPASPNFPNNGFNMANDGSGALAPIPLPPVSGSLTHVGLPSFDCGLLHDCFTHNMTDLFFLSLPPTPGAYRAGVMDMSFSDPTALNQIDTVSDAGLGSMATVVGLAADDQHLVYAFSNPPQPGCWIFDREIGSTGSSSMMVFASSQLSCMGLAIDSSASFIYFTIVSPVEPQDCGGCQPVIHGDGLGRVSLPPGGNNFESRAFGLTSDFAGPRRVLINGGMIFAVDPLTVVSIPSDALAGAHDFNP